MKAEKKLYADLTALPTAEQPIYEKLFNMLKVRVEERCSAEVVCGSGCGFTLTFALDDEMADEAYDISDSANGIVIKGKNFNSLVFGLGRLLHTSRYGDDGMRISDWRGYSAPTSPFRIIYFAIHFYNWYHTTSPEELNRYFEDLMLWGYNGVCGIFAKINLTGWDDPNVEKSYELVEKLFRAAKALNMLTVYQVGNVDFKVPKTEFAADKSGLHGKNGNLICMGTEGGYKHLLSLIAPVVERLSKIGIDYMNYFAYDEGGCSCEMCAPWGGNGFYRMSKRLHHDLRKIVPDLKAIMVLWHYNMGINDKRDFPWLDRAIREDKALGNDWVSYIMLETRFSVPDFVKEHGVPGGCKAVDFPEITMHRLEPWGGYGANPLPCEMQRMWNNVKDLVYGGMPYSEGKFDDINKVIFAGFFWDKNALSVDTLRDYIGYEYLCDQSADELIEMMKLMEKNQLLTHYSSCKPGNIEEIEKVKAIAEKVNAALPEKIKTCWRWRILYIRTQLDYIRYTNLAAAGWDFSLLKVTSRFRYWAQYLKDSPEAQELLLELINIYEMPVLYDPEVHHLHQMLRPPYMPNGRLETALDQLGDDYAGKKA